MKAKYVVEFPAKYVDYCDYELTKVYYRKEALIKEIQNMIGDMTENDMPPEDVSDFITGIDVHEIGKKMLISFSLMYMIHDLRP